jgi:hypothetical protein
MKQRKGLALTIALVGLLLATAACGDDAPTNHNDAGIDAAVPPPIDAGPDATPAGPVALAELPDAFEAAVCGFEVRCGIMPDLATCNEIVDPATTDIAQLTALVNAGTIQYDAAKAGDCLAAYRDAACTWNRDGIGPAAVCADVFEGDKAPGVDCFMDEECTDVSICETQACAGGCCKGVCKLKATPVEIGADCKNAPCADGAYCRYAPDGSATCTAAVAANGACDAVDACADGAVCHFAPGASGPGTCVALAAADASCNPAVAEPSGACAGIDRYCNPTSAKCEQRGAIGAACSSDAACIEAATCSAGHCAVRPGLNDACGATANGAGACLGGLACVNGTCAPDATEEVCP